MNKTVDKIVTGIDNTINSILPQSPEATKRRRDAILKPLGITALLAIGGFVAYSGYEAYEHWNNSVPPVPSVVDNPSQPDQTQQNLDNGTIHITVPSPQEANQ